MENWYDKGMIHYLEATVLVTGGAGFIGSAFIRYLLANEAFTGKVVCFDALGEAANLDALLSVEDDPRYFFIKGDICDAELLRHIYDEYQIDVIVNCATSRPQEDMLETNVIGLTRLLELAKRDRHIHIHHTSSDEVFGSLGQVGIFTEESSFFPNTPYAASKAAQDLMVRAYHVNYGVKSTISRASNVFGPWQRGNKLIPLMVSNCLQGRHLPIYGDGGNVRDWMHVEDYVSAIWTILQEGQYGETYHVSDANQWRNVDLVNLVVEELATLHGVDANKYKELMTFVADKPEHDLRYALDASKIRKALSWSAKKEFVPALQETIAWHIEQQGILA